MGRIHKSAWKVVNHAGQERAEDIFHTIVNKGTSVETGSKIRHIFVPPSCQETVRFSIYATETRPIPRQKRVDDADVTFLGKVALVNLVKGNKKRLELALQFGDTELRILTSG